MDASGLFTVLGIFVAIITLISEEKRQDFFIRASIFFLVIFFVFNFNGVSFNLLKHYNYCFRI